MADSRSASITFRFPEAILEELKEEADHKNITINALANQIRGSHVEWHAHASKARFIAVRRVLVKRIFDNLTGREINELAKISAEEMKGAFLRMARIHAQRSVLELMER